MNTISPYHIAKSPVLESRRVSHRDLAKKESDLTLRTNSGNIRLIPEANSFHRVDRGNNYVIDSRIATNNMPYERKHYKVGRNELCPCHSGLKFKLCCINKQKTWK